MQSCKVSPNHDIYICMCTSCTRVIITTLEFSKSKSLYYVKLGVTPLLNIDKSVNGRRLYLIPRWEFIEDKVATWHMEAIFYVIAEWGMSNWDGVRLLNPMQRWWQSEWNLFLTYREYGNDNNNYNLYIHMCEYWVYQFYVHIFNPKTEFIFSVILATS